MSQEDRRRSLADALVSRRTGSGTQEERRRSLAESMVQRRTGAAAVEDINSVVRVPPPKRSLRQIDVQGDQAPTRGRKDWDPEAAGPIHGAGIASPLTEVPSSREYSDDYAYVETIDGSGYFRVRLVTKLTMTDADGAEVIINLDAGV